MRDSDGIRTLHYNLPESSHIQHIRVEGMIDCPVYYILGLLHEVDLFPQWMPSFAGLGVRETKLLSHPTPTQLDILVKVNVPIPFTGRYSMFHADGIDCMDVDENKQVAVLLQTIDKEKEYGITYGDDGFVKMRFEGAVGFLLSPKPDGTTFLQFCNHVDPGIRIVPQWLIELLLKRVAYMVVARVRRAVEIVRDNEEFMNRVCDPESPFYNHVRKRLTEALPDQAKFIPPLRTKLESDLAGKTSDPVVLVVPVIQDD